MLGQPRKPLQKGLFYSSLAAIAVAPSSVCLYERHVPTGNKSRYNSDGMIRSDTHTGGV